MLGEMDTIVRRARACGQDRRETLPAGSSGQSKRDPTRATIEQEARHGCCSPDAENETAAQLDPGSHGNRGHRTTFGAPFANIDRLRPGDAIVLELPYAVFTYRVTGKRIVDAHDLSVLRPGTRELVVLQACHPRFFATQRILVYAEPTHVPPTGLLNS